METSIGPKEFFIHKVSKQYLRYYFDKLQNDIEANNTLYSIRYIHLGNQIVRILIYDKELDRHISNELSFIIDDQCSDRYDYTIIAWLVQRTGSSMREHRIIEEGTSSTSEPVLTIDDNTGRIVGYDDDNSCYYYGFPSSNPEILAMEGHVFFRQFYKMQKASINSSLVHGACVGIDDNGVLFCAKGNKGKSTLTVSALLKGFDFVSDDYMVIEKDGNGRLFADPVYSIITLSPEMYNRMFDELNGTRFISNNWNQSKYILSVANLHSRFKTHYPIQLCMFPEIVSDEEPSITKCNQLEKGRAITNMVHSTISQMNDHSDTANTLKIIELLKGQEFYNIRLCKDIDKNVNCLKQFLETF